jgi:hypothetical protein
VYMRPNGPRSVVLELRAMNSVKWIILGQGFE